jgi:hypothetical protein
VQASGKSLLTFVVVAITTLSAKLGERWKSTGWASRERSNPDVLAEDGFVLWRLAEGSSQETRCDPIHFEIEAQQLRHGCFGQNMMAEKGLVIAITSSLDLYRQTERLAPQLRRTTIIFTQHQENSSQPRPPSAQYPHAHSSTHKLPPAQASTPTPHPNQTSTTA